MSLLQKPRSKVWLGLILASLLAGCFPQQSQVAPEAVSEDGTTTTTLSKQSEMGKAKADVEVQLGVMMGSGSSSRTIMALVSAIEEVDYRLSGCASGNAATYSATGPQTIQLYKFDRGCVIGLQRVKVAGVNYVLPLGQSFDTQLNARTSLQSTNGKTIFAVVQSQLPALLDAPSYAVGFILTENEQGTDKVVPIYELGLSVNRTEISEGGSLTATFTVQRAVPSVGALTVNLAYSGTAIRGVDTNALPNTLQFLDGQSQVSFTVSAVDDTTLEPLETLIVDLGLGAYMSKATPLTLGILDNDVAVLGLNTPTLNFGSRALNLPHDLPVIVTNTGTVAASALQLVSGLTSPFYFPTGYPGEGGTCSTSLNPGSSCTLVLGFNPTALSAYSNALVFSYFDGVNTQNLNLTLQGTGANVGYLKTSLGRRFDFGTVASGTPAKKHIVLENIGGGTLSSLVMTFGSTSFGYAGGSFPGTGGSCTTSLAAGASCTVVIAYTSASAAAVSSSLTFTYSNGSQTLMQTVALEASANPLIAESQTVTTALNTARTITLSAVGGSGTKTYTVDKGPVFGTLSGNAPNLTYTPNTGFKGHDTFTFRANDSAGPSASAEIRILVQPEAIFIVASPNNLPNMDIDFRSRLIAKGFTVTLIDDGVSSTSQALGKDLVTVSASVRPASVLTKYRDVKLPVIIWDRGLYDDMKMIAGRSATGATGSSSAIRILENSSYMNSGYALGNLTVYTYSSKMSFVTNNDSNVQTFSSATNSTSQILEFGYDADNYMPGGLIAPGRRLGTFYPASNGDFSAAGFARIDRNIDWALQNPASLFYDSFQRNASNTVGNGWRETEATASAISTDGQQLRFETFDSMVQARNSFPIQRSGTLSASFYMDLQRTGTLSNDYQLRFQLGRCDLMDNDSSNESGIAVNLVWGGVNAGMTSENSLGYRLANGTTTTLGTVNSGQASINVDLDFTTKTFKITSPLGTTGSIAFQNDVAVDCVKFMAKNINSQNFPRRGIHHLKLLQAN
ncbi:MAG TPA: choice-of-anchor D domain-containing protein [Oligoflexus sp.]|uniref:choice-of-anchor D domain-containing protein n=1 Tax=Oligoflexus sp. TaxID=1971216 RepID=UPI002D80C29E|nr:choice-of-anchor D domain-containing protein [Oligoflexus sp.]HET9237104.1 choice-of-anchor D domain-containing protein [Oligoflexus sp.]